MKKLNYILTLIALISLFACEPSITFNEPQPTDTDKLSKFPKHIQGRYLSLTDNSTLIITDNFIFRIYDFDFKFHINQLDSDVRLSGDTVIDVKTNEKTVIKKIGDSLINHIHQRDTLFDISKTNILKKFKGYYFINTLYNADSWKVKKINLSKGKLTISRISTEQELEKLKTITESSQDTIPPYKFIATKRQFKQFIKNDGFSIIETFVRQ